MPKKVALLILDGWGIAKDKNVSELEELKAAFFN